MYWYYGELNELFDTRPPMLLPTQLPRLHRPEVQRIRQLTVHPSLLEIEGCVGRCCDPLSLEVLGTSRQ